MKNLLTGRKRYDILIYAAEVRRQKTLNLQGFPVLTLRAPEKLSWKKDSKSFEKNKKVVDKLL